ncbi:MAG: hypothetical protein ACFNYI_03100, partial [Eubacterium sp.]
QGQNFVDGIRKGDYFYLCYGNSIRLLGRFAGNDVAANSEMQGGWYERSYDLIANSKDEAPYTGPQKRWTPNDSSICVEVKADEREEFEKQILKPYFDMSLDKLLYVEEENDGTAEETAIENPVYSAYTGFSFWCLHLRRTV